MLLAVGDEALAPQAAPETGRARRAAAGKAAAARSNHVTSHRTVIAGDERRPAAYLSDNVRSRTPQPRLNNGPRSLLLPFPLVPCIPRPPYISAAIEGRSCPVLTHHPPSNSFWTARARGERFPAAWHNRLTQHEPAKEVLFGIMARCIGGR